jgi:hypothetical protein
MKPFLDRRTLRHQFAPLNILIEQLSAVSSNSLHRLELNC